jgi:hypothetical protein
MPPEAVKRQIAQGHRLSSSILAGDHTPHTLGPALAVDTKIPAKPSARRTRECLTFLSEHPDASNRDVATGIGIAHQSQISKLLLCLADQNLVSKHYLGPGQRNSWRLTQRGQDVMRTPQIRQH